MCCCSWLKMNSNFFCSYSKQKAKMKCNKKNNEKNACVECVNVRAWREREKDRMIAHREKRKIVQVHNDF